MATYKPGQIITIKGKVYRITKNGEFEWDCENCAFKNKSAPYTCTEGIPNLIFPNGKSCIEAIGWGKHLELINPKK